MNEQIEHKVHNPFTGLIETCKVDISEAIEKAEFEALKRFIVSHLRKSFDTDELKAHPFKYGQMEYLVVQLYQPTTHLTLINKLLKFSEYLFGIKQYDETLNFLKCVPETIGDIKKMQS
ncbi:MAG: hypothetical protein Q7W13_13215 [Bacteroidia bacterium]|nr:hypothetical protein [Bacteroidia bacterium]